MIPPRFWFVSIGMSLLLSFAGVAFAGQVVTDDVREQAQKAIREEKSLGAVTGKNTLAVLYFRNRSGTEELDPLRKGFAVMLITDLATVKNLQVVERIKLQALTEELGLGASGIVEPDSAPRVGRLLGAHWLVGGDISGALAEISVRSDLMEVPAEKVVGNPASLGPMEELLRMEKDMLFEILKIVRIDVTPEQRQRLMRPCSTKWSALISLFKGVDAGDRGEYQAAADLYENALREDPQICLAGDALTELRNLGLVSAKKKSGALLRSLRDGTSMTNQLTPKDELRDIPEPRGMTTETGIQLNFPNDR